ncbi:PPE domain-containing protein [Nocardia sp. NPDC049707]|uniref:PPE domain-containing protein n=1 Tax=Nocardia sp. NPDC049707 TaxID=3154735 RepID=UPI00341597ED
MVEPPIPGFTGVVWEARPTEQLAKDLMTGRGAAPMAEASAALARLAASFGGAVVEYDQIIGAIREAWRSDTSEAVLERISTLREWLIEAAGSAGQNATRAGRQAMAYELAKLTMPHVAEIAALEAAKQSIEQMGAGLGGPLVGAAAAVDAEQDLAKANAARVMRTYESAATPLATPWQHAAPPVIASSAALDAERAAAEPKPVASTPGGFAPVSFAGGFGGMTAMPRVKGAYHTRTFAQSVTEPEVTARQQSTAAAESSTSRMMPATGMSPGTAMQDAERTARAAAASALPGESVELDAGIAAAPAVLGGPVETAQATATGQAP